MPTEPLAKPRRSRREKALTQRQTEPPYVGSYQFESGSTLHTLTILRHWLCLPAALLLLALPVRAATPMLESNIERPLRYTPDGTDFVITNGAEFFNRPLYGGASAFRVDGGDKPEFSLYLPGRGGNLRLGVRTAAGVKWLNDAAEVITRYRPGSILHEIHDPLLGGGVLRLTTLALTRVEGVIFRVELSQAASATELVWGFGGVNGMRGGRDGDIGCEREPVSKFFQLRAAQCASNVVTISGNSFRVQGPPGVVAGIVGTEAGLFVGSAANWDQPDKLFATADAEATEPLLAGSAKLSPGKPFHLALQRLSASQSASATLAVYSEVAAAAAANGAATGGAPLLRAVDLPNAFAVEEAVRRAIAERVVVETPDPFINAAAAALSIAADAVWDDRQQAYLHGGVAWRVRLLGWRVSYAGDELGWHERTAAHFAGYAKQQNTNAIPAAIPPPEESANLSRNETALHSNGDLTKSHYDMNLVGVDAFFRHLLWTGDLEYARRMWPTIERHLAWERRLFRREYGPEKLPLYEAYCCIWASDDLAYNGGGATHSSAYNLFHNRLAARVAKLLGKDPVPYEREAELIGQAMRKELWLTNQGWFAEWKDLLGQQLQHPNAAAWTFYHTVDSEVPSALEAWQMTRAVDTQLARIPLRGPGVPDGNYTIPTTSWMPYTWSLNNVVLAETMHTALAYWQAGRAEGALPLFRGAILDSMYLGLCPGNVGMCTYFDANRRESQRDFGDGVGAMSRALVEGLFGVKPDVLAGELTLQPGFPEEWNRASIRHPDFSFAFRRDGLKEVFTVEPRFPKAMALRLQIPALRDGVASAVVNGQPAKWRVLPDAAGSPRIEIMAAPAARNEIVVEWRGERPAGTNPAAVFALGRVVGADFQRAKVLQVSDPQGTLTNVTLRGNGFEALTIGALGHRTVFAQVAQGELTWWQPVPFELRPPYEIIAAATQDAEHLRFRFRNNTPNDLATDAAIQFGGRTLKQRLTAPWREDSEEIVLPGDGLLPGTIAVAVDYGQGQRIAGTVTNWKLKPGGAAVPKLELVDLASQFNDRVTQIFRNEYRAPRSPYCSLAMPKQGIGSWCHPQDKFDVDDAGLRAVSSKASGRFVSTLGVPFATPGEGDARNIAFVSQWTNYPAAVEIPLAGQASRIFLLMAGTAPTMQSRFDNGEVVVTYTDGTTARLALHNPTTWWPIDQDYFIDDYAFRRPEPIPPRVDLKSGTLRVLDLEDFKGKGTRVPGGAATVLDLPLDPAKELKSLSVRALANEVVIGLMSVTLARD